MSHPVYRWKCIMSLQPCISTSDVRMLSWSRICSFISSCICRNIFANIPALRNWWQVFYRLVKFFSEKCKNMRNWKKSERELMVQFSRYMLFVGGGAESREMTSEAFCYVEWPPSPAKPFPCLSLHLQKLRLLFLFFV